MLAMQMQWLCAVITLMRGHNSVEKGTLLDPKIVPSAKQAIFRPNSVGDYG